MTLVTLHGILAREYGNTFLLKIGNPKSVLEAIDCNRGGFVGRVVELQKEGFLYDIIINKKRIIHGEEMDNMKNPATIDLVPAITGRGPGVMMFFATHTFLAAVAKALIFAAINYALTPKPEGEAGLELEASASKSSLIFSNTVNVASQGAPLPVGYGRLKVGSQVIQATMKSFPQSQRASSALLGNPHVPEDGGGATPIYVTNEPSNPVR